MTKKKLYKYLGNNGILITYVYLEGVKHIPMYHLEADEGKLLTNGERTAKSIDIEGTDLDSWSEIPDKFN